MIMRTLAGGEDGSDASWFVNLFWNRKGLGEHLQLMIEMRSEHVNLPQ